MIRVYLLETEVISNSLYVKGHEYIHDAILDFEDGLRKLIQDTTASEHNELIKVADSWREATKGEIAQLNQMKSQFPITPVRNLAKEIDKLKARIASWRSKCQDKQ